MKTAKSLFFTLAIALVSGIMTSCSKDDEYHMLEYNGLGCIVGTLDGGYLSQIEHYWICNNYVLYESAYDTSISKESLNAMLENDMGRMYHSTADIGYFRALLEDYKFTPIEIEMIMSAQQKYLDTYAWYYFPMIGNPENSGGGIIHYFDLISDIYIVRW